MAERSVTSSPWNQDPKPPPRYVLEYSYRMNWLLISDDTDTPEPGTPSLVNPSSALLQDLLKEQRAHRGSRGNISEDLEHSAPRTPETVRLHDDTASEKARKVNDALSAGQRKPKEMGMREMDTVSLLEFTIEDRTDECAVRFENE